MSAEPDVNMHECYPRYRNCPAEMRRIENAKTIELFFIKCKMYEQESEGNMLPEAGSSVYVQSYKHNGSLHRTWCMAYVLEADEEKIVTVTDRAWVIEADGRKWLTREPAVCFFYTHKWFNVISMIRHGGIYYYCNLASPSIYDGEAIRNVDYDLDVKLYPDDSYQILDGTEYADHANAMKYPEKVMEIVEAQLDQILAMMKDGKAPFNKEYVDRYYRRYLEMTRETE